MDTLNYILITFIGTFIFVGMLLTNSYFLVNKNNVKKNKYIMTDDGTIWEKVNNKIEIEE